MAWLQDVLPSVIDAEPDEAVPVGWAFLYFFCLLCGYYILRPVRDEMAIEGGVQHLPWMMTATFVTLLLVTPLFGWLSARVSRHRLLQIVYAFFALHLVLFFVAMISHLSPQWAARTFFVWLSVFNLFVVSMFWSVMADLFTPTQGARLFGVIAAGGSIGAMVGPLLTTGLTYLIPIPALLLVSVGFLVACGLCLYQLDRWAKSRPSRQISRQGEPIGGSIWAGVRLALSSPYLLGICLYLFFLTTTATFLYLEQMRLVSEQIPSPEERTRLFALIDLVVNVFTFLAQVMVTSRVISRFGLASALVVLPIASAIGFGIIAVMPLLTVFIMFTIVRRVGEYAFAKPAREVLFTVVSREEKYKAKNFIDTAVSRGGDAATGWIVNGVKALSVTAGQMAWALVPLALLWGWVGWFLARQEETLRLNRSEVDLPPSKATD
ncbi:MAG TPA: MFS transporter [Nitrospiraceae bacterium]|nr:MFS transporter [Nitrospiraceae bacterium]